MRAMHPTLFGAGQVGLLTPGLAHIVSVLHPKNLVVVFCRSLGIQVLLMINVYMMQLLEHEQRCLEADERGEQAPNDAPPIPSFKPCFDRGLMLGCRELSVAIVRRIYEAVAVYRMGRSKADVLLRDAKSWIRNVLAFRHRQVDLRCHIYLVDHFPVHPFIWFLSLLTVIPSHLIVCSSD